MQAATGPLISLSPSFNTYSSSNRLAQIASRVVNELTSQDHELAHHDSVDSYENMYDHHHHEEQRQQQPQNEDVKEEVEEFEFAFASREQHASPISADEIFSNGQIRSVYPLFDQDLLKHEYGVVSSKNVNGDAVDDDGVKNSKRTTTPTKQRRLPLRMLMFEEERGTSSCSSSEADDLENPLPGTYCVWTPPKAAPKSSSASSSKRWKFRNLLYRSSSDGKGTFVPLAPSTKRADSNSNKEVDVARKRVGRDGVSQNEERYVVKNTATEEGDKRRSFLPYKQDFVGFFNVNGLSRNLHPF